jgi:hypothetical protein
LQLCTNVNLFQLLLGAEIVGVTALLLTAVNGTRVKTSVASRSETKKKVSLLYELLVEANGNENEPAADKLVAVVLAGKLSEGRLNDTSAKTENEVEGGLYSPAN